MIKVVIVSALVVVCCTAYGGVGNGAVYSKGTGNYGNAGAGYLANYRGGQIIKAAIQTRHQIQYRDVPSTGSVNPTVIQVDASPSVITILFKSASSNLNIQQHHEGAQGSTKETSSQDEAHVLKHSVTKPIVQEIREVITPSRKIIQEIHPVIENIITIVAKGNEQPVAQLVSEPVQADPAPRHSSLTAPVTSTNFLGNSQLGLSSDPGSLLADASFGQVGSPLGSLGATKGGY